MNPFERTEAAVVDLGGKRRVTIDGPHLDMGRLIPCGETFETSLSAELIESIIGVHRASNLKDEISRTQVYEYITGPIDEAVSPIVSLRGKRVLDFGSGGGASAVALCRIGADEVECVEINEALVRITRLRARDLGFGGNIRARLVEDTRNLPFADNSFYVIVCNAVIEHIHPALRRSHLEELWRVLKPGGYIFIMETPNRLWPKEGHTTGLPLVPYMPLRMARRYAILFSRNVSSRDSVDDLITRGIRGSTYREIHRAFKGSEYIPNDDLRRYFTSSTTGQSERKKRLKKGAMALFRILDATICRLFSIPVASLLPSLSLCFKKGSAGKNNPHDQANL